MLENICGALHILCLLFLALFTPLRPQESLRFHFLGEFRMSAMDVHGGEWENQRNCAISETKILNYSKIECGVSFAFPSDFLFILLSNCKCCELGKSPKNSWNSSETLHAKNFVSGRAWMVRRIILFPSISGAVMSTKC